MRKYGKKRKVRGRTSNRKMGGVQDFFRKEVRSSIKKELIKGRITTVGKPLKEKACGEGGLLKFIYRGVGSGSQRVVTKEGGKSM